MKKSLRGLCLLAVVSAPAKSAEVEMLKDVAINLCPKGMAGCYPTVTIGQEKSRYLLGRGYAEEFLKKHGNLVITSPKSVKVKEIMGVVVVEKGHFPNPNVEFEVFKTIRIVE